MLWQRSTGGDNQTGSAPANVRTIYQIFQHLYDKGCFPGIGRTAERSKVHREVQCNTAHTSAQDEFQTDLLCLTWRLGRCWGVKDFIHTVCTKFLSPRSLHNNIKASTYPGVKFALIDKSAGVGTTLALHLPPGSSWPCSATYLSLFTMAKLV